ncbi:hypothetical protein, partial [Helicobacter sp. 13S00482-2]|uniref:hypothetical protein n=1 Tax=Helicobacter sp. 13S00482-2 TaxID=1476200 RepID=UPI001C5D4CBD
MLDYIDFGITLILLSIPIINFIFFYMHNQFSRVDKVIFIIIFIIGLFVAIAQTISYYIDGYSILFYGTLFYYIVSYYI